MLFVKSFYVFRSDEIHNRTSAKKAVEYTGTK